MKELTPNFILEPIAEKPITENTRKERKLIYVDISGMNNNRDFRVGLYYPYKNVTLTLQLKDSVIDNNEAEKYAIYYAIYYSIKNNIDNAHILCDNKGAVNSEELKRVIKKYNIGLSWIPREANITADRISRLEANQREEESHILEFMVYLNSNNSNTLIEENNINNASKDIIDLKSVIGNRDREIKELKMIMEEKDKKIKDFEETMKVRDNVIANHMKIIETKNQKIKNQTAQINNQSKKIKNQKK